MKKYAILFIVVCGLALTGCSARLEYKTIVIPNDAVPLNPPSNGWISNDSDLNAMLKDGWSVAGYSVDRNNSQWFLLKRNK
jgi:hypothetical protein